jgi:hypothetical protein
MFNWLICCVHRTTRDMSPIVGVMPGEMGVYSLVVVVGAFLGIDVVGPVVGIRGGGVDQSAGVQPFLHHYVELCTEQRDDALQVKPTTAW